MKFFLLHTGRTLFFAPLLASLAFASQEISEQEGEEAEMSDSKIQVFMGYDSRSPIGHHVCEQSIVEFSSKSVAITPLYLSNLRDIFTREKLPTQLTDFTYSRFIVPALCDYKGWSLFIDGNDMLFRDDIAKIWALRDARFAVMVVKHPEFTGKHSFGGKEIQTYPMLNWSSVMLLNNAKCKSLTPDYVNTAGYYDLHQFKWLESEELIGELPHTWNHLVGYYEPSPDAAIVHWTLGAPYQGGEFAEQEHVHEWLALRDRLVLPHF
jgi:hypothetical protein